MNHDLPREKKAFSMFRNSFDKVRINFERVGLAIEQVDKTIPSKAYSRISSGTACTIQHASILLVLLNFNRYSFYLPELFLKENVGLE